MNWDDLKILYYVATRGSFLRAGQDLDMAASTVSRRITQLEESLSLTLLERGVDGCRLTAQGEEFTEIAKAVSEQVDRQLAMAKKGIGALTGSVKVTAGEGFSEMLTAVIVKFSTQNPKCAVDFSIESDYQDVVRGKVDVAVRTGNMGETSLIYRKVAEISFGLFSSQDYINNNQDKLTPELIDYIDLLPPMDQAPHKRAAREAGLINTRVRMSSFRAQSEAVRLGFGVAAIPRIQARQKQLIEIFPNIQLPPMEVFVATRPQSLKQPHLRAFVDMVYETFKNLRKLEAEIGIANTV